MLSSVKFDVGKRDETKTAITTNNHIYATSIYTYIAPHKKAQNATQKHGIVLVMLINVTIMYLII
jgi:hypothetical protein